MRLLSVALLVQHRRFGCSCTAYSFWQGPNRVLVRPKPYSFFVNNPIYTPGGKNPSRIPVIVEIQNGTILATVSLRGRRSPAALPIFESKDGGASWKWVTDFENQVNRWGLGNASSVDWAISFPFL